MTAISHPPFVLLLKTSRRHHLSTATRATSSRTVPRSENRIGSPIWSASRGVA